MGVSVLDHFLLWVELACKCGRSLPASVVLLLVATNRPTIYSGPVSVFLYLFITENSIVYDS